MEWNRGIELWNGMEWVFGMEYGMKILTYNFGVRVTNLISWEEMGHSHDNSYFLLLTQVHTKNTRLLQSSSNHSQNDINTRVIIQNVAVIT